MTDLSLKGVKTLVTGGAGLIGSHIADKLLDLGAQVRIFDNLEPQTHPHGKPNWIPKDAEFIHGDMRDLNSLRKAVGGIEVVFHQAAFGGFTSEASKYFDVNATGTARLYEALADEGKCRKVVAASSQAVYGEGLYECVVHGKFHPILYRNPEDMKNGFFRMRCPTCGEAGVSRPVPEILEHFGETPYALSKHLEERTVLAFGRKFGIPSTALRYAVTFGPRQSVFNPYTGVVSIFSTQILNGKRPVVYEDGHQTRDYIFVDNVAEANVFVAMEKNTDGLALNVGTGKPTSVLELVSTLNKLYGTNIQPQIRSFRPGDVRDFYHDTSSLGNLGYRATVTLEEGLKRHASWIQGLGSLKEYFEDAEKQLRIFGVVMD